jgi:peptidoglycan/xylan/chitin deacetylase (PgdA/CDA1 family)
MKIFAILVLCFSHLFAGWMFVNDDGSLTPYQEEITDETYSIPSTDVEIEKPIKIKKIKPKKRKPKIRSYKKALSSENIYPQNKIIYLTFDDGPLNGSENVIDVLEEEGVRATMFMIGKHIDRSQNNLYLFQRAVDSPFIFVANHTYSHANGRYKRFYSSPQRVYKDLTKMNEKIENANYSFSDIKYCRLAGRNVFRIDDIVCDDPAIPRYRKEFKSYNLLSDNGFMIYGWDYQWSYNPRNGKVYKSPQNLVNILDKIYKRGKTKKRGKLILLMHDFSFKDSLNGKETLRELIALLRDRGWSFESIESY